MARYAIIDTVINVVTNVVEWDGQTTWSAPPGTLLKESAVAAPLWTYDTITEELNPPAE